MLKRFLGLALAFVMVLTLMPSGLAPDKAQAGYGDYSQVANGITIQGKPQIAQKIGNDTIYEINYIHKFVSNKKNYSPNMSYAIDYNSGKMKQNWKKTEGETVELYKSFKNSDSGTTPPYTYVYKCQAKVSVNHVQNAGKTLYFKLKSGPENDDAIEDSMVFKISLPMLSYKDAGVRAYGKSTAVNRARVTVGVNREGQYNYVKVLSYGKPVAEQYIPYDKSNTVNEATTKSFWIPYGKKVPLTIYFGVKRDGKVTYSKDYLKKTVTSKKIYGMPPGATRIEGSKIGLKVRVPYGVTYLRVQKYNPNKKKYVTIKTTSKDTYFIDWNKYSKKYYRCVAIKKEKDKTYASTGKSVAPIANVLSTPSPGIDRETMKLNAKMTRISYKGKTMYVRVEVANSTYYITRTIKKITISLRYGKSYVFKRSYSKNVNIGPRSKKTFYFKIPQKSVIDLHRYTPVEGCWAYAN